MVGIFGYLYSLTETVLKTSYISGRKLFFSLLGLNTEYKDGVYTIPVEFSGKRYTIYHFAKYSSNRVIPGLKVGPIERILGPRRDYFYSYYPSSRDLGMTGEGEEDEPLSLIKDPRG